jgi:acyl carrier protein
VAPRNPTETAVAQIWCEVLNLKEAGMYDNFFDRGGHSLLVTQVMSRVRERFHVDLPIRRLFEQPTIAATAALIEELLIQEIQGLSDEEAEAQMQVSAGANSPPV